MNATWRYRRDPDMSSAELSPSTMCTSTPFSYKSKLGSVWIDFNSSRPYTNRTAGFVSCDSGLGNPGTCMRAAKRTKLIGHQAAYLNDVNIKLKILPYRKKMVIRRRGVSKTMIGYAHLCLRIKPPKLSIFWLKQPTKGTPAESKHFTRRIHKGGCRK